MQTHSIQQHVSLGPVHPGWRAQQEAFCIKSNEKQVHCLHLTNIFHRPDITFPLNNTFGFGMWGLVICKRSH